MTFSEALLYARRPDIPVRTLPQRRSEDAPNGSIVWEGVDELQYSVDTPMENAVTLKKVLEQASAHLVDKLPKKTASNRALP